MKKLLLLSTLGVFVAMPAMAGHHEGPDGKKGPRHEKMLEHMFEKDDLDKDGAISKEEFVKSSEERFTNMDADADGKVTKEEAKKHHEEKRAKWKEMKEKRGDAKEAAEQAGDDKAEVPAE